MVQKMKCLISFILVFLLTFTNTDTLFAISAEASSRAEEGDWAYTVSANSQDGVTITGYTGSDTDVVVPGALGGYPVRTVESDAFPRTVTSITFPKEVTEIRHLGFSSIKTLERFIVEEGNENYFSRDGVLYHSSQEGKKLFCFPQAKKMAEVTIPEDVLGIEAYAFYKCTGIENVVIGNHVTAIEQRAFSNSSVKNLTLGSGLKSFCADAFESCRQLETVSISGAMVLQEEWEENPFYGCVGLKEISIVGDGGQYTLRDGVLFGNGGKRLLAYPSMKTGDSYVVPDTVEEIADGAFYRSWNLKQAALPNHLKKIGAYAFKGAELLQSVTGAEQLKVIGESAFFACKKLEVFELPDTLEQVGGEAFCQCTNFAGPVVFPSCLKSIGDNVFTDCGKVTEITFLAKEFQINNNRTSIANHIVIKGYKESSAENYAKLCGKTFEDIETGERVDYSYTEQTLLNLLPKDLSYGEPVRWDSVVHEYDTGNEKYVGLKVFTDNLVKDCTTDVEKMTKICDWVGNHITYKYGVPVGATIDSVYHTFYEENPTGNCEVYAQLTAYMLYLENIPCVLASSYTHQWCDAYSAEDEKWYMVDATSGFIFESGALSSSETYALRTISFSSDGMVLEISNTSGVELAAFNYGELSSEVTEFTIPDYIANIQDGVFDYYGLPEDFLLHGKTGTYAEQYVKSNGYECILYQGNTFTACKTHKKKEIKNEETGIRKIVCERCETELETGTFLNQPKITSLADTGSGVKVVWNRVPLAEKYRVYRKVCQDPKTYGWKLLGETESATFLDEDSDVVKFGGAYYYTVQAVNGELESAYNSDTDNSGPYVVCKPGNAEVYQAVAEDGGIHLYWGGSGSRRYMGVEIYRSTDGGSYEKVSSVEDVDCKWVDMAADKTKCNMYYLRTYNKAKDTVVYGENSESVTVANLTGASIELSPSAFTYNGKMQTPEITVKAGNAVLQKDTDYTVTVRDNVNAGIASLTVKGKGFVSGSQTKTYTIEKAAASLTLAADKTTIDTNGCTVVRTSGFWEGSCSFKSSNDAVATVTGNGLVTGVSAGEATITVTSEDTANCASGSASVTITVTQGSCNHNYVYTKTSDANCTSPETGTYTCSKCKDSYTSQNGEKLGHDYQETVIAPACTAEGYTDYQCSRCGDSYQGNYVPASGHSYGSGTVTKQATCETDGERTFQCKYCEEAYTLTIPAFGHSYGMGHMIKEPTCLSEGVWEYECQNCGGTYTETTDKGDHDFYTQFFYPGCTTEGYYAHICQVCGLEGERVVADPAFGHDFSENEAVVLKEATCTQPGEAELTCNRCGQTQRKVIPIAPHDYQEETIKEVTCTESGEKKYTCSICKKTKSETVAPLGHAYGLEQFMMPTCTEEGGVYKTCLHCGDISWQEKNPARGHNFVLKETIRPATCESDGEAIYQCSRCEEQQTRTEAATGHEYLPEHEEVKASCWTEGKIISVCLNCGNKKIRTVPKKEHNYSCQIISKPTANQPGRRKYTCSICGHSYYESFTEDGESSNGKQKNTIQTLDITKVTKSSKQSFTLKVTQKGNGTLSFKSSNPAVTVDSSGKVTVAKDFVGKVTITIWADATKDYQAAQKQITLCINPAPVKITRAVSQKQKLVVKWKRNAKVTGYQIQYAMDKKFKSSPRTAKIKKNKTISFKSPKLKKGRTYYVRVRTYKNGCYSAWSKRKAVKIQK